MDHATKLLETTLRELFQAERSASRHPLVEAERLGEAPPARPMLAIADHAVTALKELSVVRGMQPSHAAMGIGRSLSAVRNGVLDRATSRQQSYRATLVGVKHGIDLVRLLRELARAGADEPLTQWCDTWLELRTHLASEAEQAFAWFANHPERANAPARPSVVRTLAFTALRAVYKPGARRVPHGSTKHA